jgi:hypothetical protein
MITLQNKAILIWFFYGGSHFNHWQQHVVFLHKKTCLLAGNSLYKQVIRLETEEQVTLTLQHHVMCNVGLFIFSVIYLFK